MSTSETREPEAGVEEDPPASGKRKARRRVFAVILVFLRVLGVVFAIDAVMSTRTAQGAVAWSVALVSIPAVSVPAYLVFGRSKFVGYVESWREQQEEIDAAREVLRESFTGAQVDTGDERLRGVESLMPRFRFTGQNSVELLIDGDQTFDGILSGIAEAEDYVLVQFYIVHDDGIGRRLKQAMIDKAGEGVRVFFLFDEVGSSKLPASYLDELRAAGVEASRFNTRQGWRNRFQLNFRNHRKIVVVDGRLGFVGGLNVGDEYLGLDPEVGFWRDTHVRVEGPSVVDLQRAFTADWYWATRELLEFSWVPVPAPDGADMLALALPTGPADRYETAGLMFVELINQARERLWIGTPYFVPDEAVIKAVELAAHRGVDVRIMVPRKGDSVLVSLSAWSYAAELGDSGARFWLYEKGFMHHKIMLVDDDISLVGTANMDNRSFRLNFEVSQIIVDRGFAQQMEAMFLDDFEHTTHLDPRSLDEQSFLRRLAVRVARLSAPIL